MPPPPMPMPMGPAPPQLSSHVTSVGMSIKESSLTVFVKSISLDPTTVDAFLNFSNAFAGHRPTRSGLGGDQQPPSSSSSAGSHHVNAIAVPAAFTPKAVLICAQYVPHPSIRSADGACDACPPEMILRRLDIVKAPKAEEVKEKEVGKEASTTKKGKKQAKVEEVATSASAFSSGTETAPPEPYRLREYGWSLGSGHEWQLNGPARAVLRLKLLLEEANNDSSSPSSSPRLVTIPIVPSSEKDSYAQHPSVLLQQQEAKKRRAAADAAAAFGADSTSETAQAKEDAPLLPSAVFADIGITVSSRLTEIESTEKLAAIAAEERAIKKLNHGGNDDDEAMDPSQRRRSGPLASASTAAAAHFPPAIAALATPAPRRDWRLIMGPRRWYAVRPEVRQATVRDSFFARHKYELSAQSLQHALDEERYAMRKGGRGGPPPPHSRRNRRQMMGDSDDDDFDDEEDLDEEDLDDEEGFGEEEFEEFEEGEEEEDSYDDDEGSVERMAAKFPTLEQRLMAIRLAAKDKYSGSVHEAMAVSSCGRFVLWRDGTETPMAELRLFESTFVPSAYAMAVAAEHKQQSTLGPCAPEGLRVYRFPNPNSDVIGTIPFNSEATAIGMATNAFTGEVYVCWQQLFKPHEYEQKNRASSSSPAAAGNSAAASVVASLSGTPMRETYKTHPSFTVGPLSFGGLEEAGGAPAQQQQRKAGKKAARDVADDACPDLIPAEEDLPSFMMNSVSSASVAVGLEAPPATIASEGVIGWSLLKGYTAPDEAPSSSLSNAKSAKGGKQGKKGSASSSSPSAPHHTAKAEPAFFLVERKLQSCIVFGSPRYFTSSRADRGVRVRAEPSLQSRQVGIMDANEVKEAVAVHVDKKGNAFIEWREMASSPGYTDAAVSPVPNTCGDATAVSYSVVMAKQKREATSAAAAAAASANANQSPLSVLAPTDISFAGTATTNTAEPQPVTPTTTVSSATVVPQQQQQQQQRAKSPCALANAKAKRSNGGYSLVRGPQGSAGGSFLVEIFPFSRTLAPLNFADIAVAQQSPSSLFGGGASSDSDNEGTEQNKNAKKSAAAVGSKRPREEGANAGGDDADEIVDLDRERDRRRRANDFVNSLNRSRACLVKDPTAKSLTSRRRGGGDSDDDVNSDDGGDDKFRMRSKRGFFFGDDDEDDDEEDDEEAFGDDSDDFDDDDDFFGGGDDEEDYEEGDFDDEEFDDEEDWDDDSFDDDDDDDDSEVFAPVTKKGKAVAPTPAPSAAAGKKKATPSNSNTNNSSSAPPKPVREEPISDGDGEEYGDSVFDSDYGSEDYDKVRMDEGSFAGSDDEAQFGRSSDDSDKDA